MTDEVETTTVALSKDTKKRLDGCKVHPRETYDDVVNRLMRGVSP